MYGRGEGVSKNIIESVGWFRKAAMQRIVYAQHNLGYIYLIGEGVPKNIDESIRWLRKAAMQGLADSQYLLGALNMGWDEVIAPDYKEAEKWFGMVSDRMEEDPDLDEMVSRRLKIFSEAP